MENLMGVGYQLTLSCIKDIANNVEGVYVDYDDNRFALIIPLQDNKRIQKVFGVFDENFEKVEFHSIVCDKEQADLVLLLNNQKSFNYSKFIIDADKVMISASVMVDYATPDILEEVMMEVATNADIWEKRFTAQDIY